MQAIARANPNLPSDPNLQTITDAKQALVE